MRLVRLGWENRLARAVEWIVLECRLCNEKNNLHSCCILVVVLESALCGWEVG